MRTKSKQVRQTVTIHCARCGASHSFYGAGGKSAAVNSAKEHGWKIGLWRGAICPKCRGHK